MTAAPRTQRLAIALCLLLLPGFVGSARAAATRAPIGEWDFDDPRDMLRATRGTALRLQGTVTSAAGPSATNGAVRIGVGSRFLCTHGIPVQAPATRVNRFSLLFDFRLPALGPWYCFFQTDPANTGDGDCFVRATDGRLGVAQTGYSDVPATAGRWQRMIVSVDNLQGTYRIYLDGALVLEGKPQATDGRFSLAPTLLLFADDNGEDATLEVSRVAVYDVSLTATEAASLGGVEPSTPGAGVYLTPPYLQNPRTNGITVLWEMDGTVAAPAEIEYGVDRGYGASAPATSAPSGAGTQIYRCTIDGLAAGTRHAYRVRVGGTAGPEGWFTMAPVGAPDFAFAVWSDSQGSNHGAYAADPLEPTKSMMRHMAAGGLSFAVTTGDLAENGASYSDTRQFYLDRVAGLLGPTVPWYVAWGNHDGGIGTVIRRFADLPSKERPGFGPGHGSFSFDHAGCHFICLDYATMESDVLNWLETDLRSAGHRDARFTFLFVHVPPYCELWIDGSDPLRSRLVPLLERYGVDACFSGHTHEYSRGYLNGVRYCITGGGSWLDSPEILVRDWPHMTVGGYHRIPGLPAPAPTQGGGLVNEYVRIEVRGNSYTGTMIAFAPDGTELGVLDRFGPTDPGGEVRLVGASPAPGGLDLEWTGPNGPFRIQHRAALEVGAWLDIGPEVAADQRSIRLARPDPTGFYRVRLVR